jgi:hypothetical protein
MELTKGLRQEPQRIVIYGPEGIGKSTLASQLPDPVFIDVEGSTSDLDVVRAPSPSSWRALVDMVAEFARDHNNRQTLVIDTADWAEHLCISHVCASNNLTSLGGQEDFGRSYNLLETEWCRFLDSLSRVAASGMHVCLLAHTGVKNVRQPDLDKGYDRWELKMERKTAAATKEWARTVLFLNFKTYIVEGKDKKKTATGGHRVIYATHAPAFDAKNRGGLPDEMRLEYAAIAQLFGQQPQPQKEPLTPQQGQVASAPPAAEPPVKTEPQVAPPVSTSTATPHLKPLLDLIERDKVSPREVQLAVAKRGYYPADTPLENYDPQFVAGKLVAYWPKVVEWIEVIRKEAAA